MNGIVAVSQCPLIILTLCLAWHGIVRAQENTETPAPAAASDEVAAPAATPQESAAVDPPLPGNPDQGCMQKIIDQHALTLKIREINNPLERIPEPKFLQLRRPVATGIQSGAEGAADLENLSLVLKYRLFQATDPTFVANSDNVKNLFNEMDREIRGAGGQAGNAQRTKAYRQKYSDTVLAVAKQMFDNNLDARSIAIQIIKELYVNKTAAGLTENHSESMAALLGLLKDPEQPDSVKVMAAAAVSYVLTNTSVIPQEQDSVSDVIAAELNRPCTEIAYQLLLVDTLFSVTQPRKSSGRRETNVMQTFVKLVDDRQRPLQVRCRAAFGIGQGAYDAKVDFDPLTWKVANLALEASVFFNQAPGDPAWQQCGADLFFAYRHIDKNGLAKQPPMLPQGMMNRAATSVPVNESGSLAAFKIAVPLVVNNAKIPQADQVELKAWIDGNKALENKPWE
ncbi:MAG: hypothetical protein WKF77_15095 [Planctomycetaceae bacterium]